MGIPSFNDFDFADAKSKKNAQLAWSGGGIVGPSCFVVIGPPCSGKTSFVRACLQHRFPGPRPLHAGVPCDRELNFTIPFAIEGGYAWFEDVSKVKSPLLLNFITSKEWVFRKPRTTALQTAINNTVVFITGPEDLGLNVDLARRARFIRMGQR